jgi:aldose 1-epimerase
MSYFGYFRGLYNHLIWKCAPYFGATIGRFAGRINDSEFALNGEPIHLKNHNNHSLHGGTAVLVKKIWKVKNVNNGKILL